MRFYSDGTPVHHERLDEALTAGDVDFISCKRLEPVRRRTSSKDEAMLLERVLKELYFSSPSIECYVLRKDVLIKDESLTRLEVLCRNLPKFKRKLKLLACKTIIEWKEDRE